MAALAQEGSVLRARIIPLLLALGLRLRLTVRVTWDTISTLVLQTGAVLRVLLTRLLLALDLRLSQHVRVMLDTTATLHQRLARHARLAGIRVSARMEVTRVLCVMRVPLTRIRLALDLQS